MIGKFSVEWLIKVAGVAVLIAAGFGKSLAAIFNANAESTGIIGAIALGVGLYLAAPIAGDLLKKTP